MLEVIFIFMAVFAIFGFGYCVDTKRAKNALATDKSSLDKASHMD